MTPNFGKAGLAELNLSGVNLTLAKFSLPWRYLSASFGVKFDQI
ncbi:MAG: hypothetical protein ACTTJF_07505 [Campylobacter sp.]